MNRIYQGKVTKVEILKPSPNSLPASTPLAPLPPSPHPMGRGAGGEVSDESKPATTLKEKYVIVIGNQSKQHTTKKRTTRTNQQKDCRPPRMLHFHPDEP
jgi:hypothetical protein